MGFFQRAVVNEAAAPKLRHALVLALTVTSGATDVIGFVALGQAFTSVMTGNLVLLGISMADGDGRLARHVLAAIVCYIVGCVFGSKLAGTTAQDQPVWPPAVTRALLVELTCFVAFAVAWWATGAMPTGSVQLALLAANAVALGVQSSAVQRFGVGGLSTTYMTGTLTTLIGRVTSGGRVRDIRDSLEILGSLIAGAAIAALLLEYAPMFVPLLQLVPVTFVVARSLSIIKAEAERRRHDADDRPIPHIESTAGRPRPTVAVRHAPDLGLDGSAPS